MTMLRAGGLLDVLTPLSDCRRESVEKMERRISGVSYMCWIDFHNGILGFGFLCARLISVSLFLGLYHSEGYHARTYAIKLTGYHVCRVTTPELPRSKQTSGYRQVTTPAGSFYLFFLSSVIRQSIHNNFSTEPGTHRTDPLNTHGRTHS